MKFVNGKAINSKYLFNERNEKCSMEGMMCTKKTRMKSRVSIDLRSNLISG